MQNQVETGKRRWGRFAGGGQAARRVIAVILVVVLAGAALQGYRSLAARREKANAPQSYVTMPVTRGSIQVTVSGSGTATLRDRLEVRAGVAGTVDKILVAAGQAVQAGQVLARLASDTAKTQLEQARLDLDIARTNLDSMLNPSEADVAAAELKVRKLELQLETQQLNLDRHVIRAATAGTVRTLNINKGDQVSTGALLAQMDIEGGNRTGSSVTERDVTVARARLQQAEEALAEKVALRDDLAVRAPADGQVVSRLVSAGDSVAAGTKLFTLTPAGGAVKLPTATALDLEIAQKRVDQARDTLQARENDRAKLTLTAPIAGTVSGLTVKAGDNLNNGAKVATIHDFGQITFEVKVGQHLVTMVKPGQRAEVWIQSTGPLTGWVTKVAVDGVPEGRTVVYPVEITLANNYDFRPGMTGTAAIWVDDLNTFYFSGSITALRQETVVARLAGEVAEVLVNNGDSVVAGQPLVRMDGTTLENQIRQARIDLEVAENNLAKLYSTTDISAKVAGTVRSVAVKEGDVVRAGQVLAVIDGATLEKQIRQAELDVEVARNNLEKLYVPGEVRARVAGTVREVLVAEGDRVPENQVLAYLDDAELRLQIAQTQNDLAAAKNDLEKLRRPELKASDTQVTVQRLKVQQAELTVATRRAEVESLTINAPVTGTIISVQAKEGDQVNKGAPLLVISDPGGLQVTVNVDELDIAKVKLGQVASVTFSALPGRQFRGEVTSIAMEGVSQSGVTTYPVTIAVFDAADVLPGMSADVTILVERKDNVLLVPAEGVTTRGQRSLVTVMVDGAPQMRPVQVGLTTPEVVEILSGLVEGEEIVVVSLTTTSGSGASQMPMGIPGMRMPVGGGGSFQGGGFSGGGRR